MSGLIFAHHGHLPKLDGVLYVAPNATIVGEVRVGTGCSFWFNSVTRGDVHSIEIGDDTNVQDLSMLHVSYKRAPLKIGNQVTIGHGCVLHGCTVGDRVLVGMGSVLMDHVVVESDVLIGAGTLLTEGTHIPAGSLVMGRPGAVKRALKPEELAYLKQSAEHYKRVARSYSSGESLL